MDVILPTTASCHMAVGDGPHASLSAPVPDPQNLVPKTISAMKTVLFLCTGNYYRSRYAEILFNWKAQHFGLKWKADSRGLDPDPLNAGPMSRHTTAALKKLGIAFDKHLRLPLVAKESDFQA